MKYKLLVTLFCLSALVQSPAALVNDFDYYLPPGEVVWLGGEQKVLVLEQSNRLAYDRGSILLIPEWSMHPYQSMPIQRLYQNMPDYGWHSLALQPPTQSLTAFRWQADTAERYPEPVSASELDELRQQLTQRVELAMEKSRENPGPLVIVAQGVTAGFLIDLFSSQRLPLPDAFVIHGAYLPQWQLNDELAVKLAQLRMPVLDLSPIDGNQWVTAGAGRRQTMAMRHQHTAYRQRVLPAGTHSMQPRHLEHHLYGWLRSNDF